MKRTFKIAKIVTKILEIGHWVAAGLMALVAACAAFAPQWLRYVMDVASLADDPELATYGFAVAVVDASGAVNWTILLLTAIGCVVVLSLMAMVFRNLYLITKKSERSTPFQPDNVRMLREIGIFSCSIPIVDLLFDTVIRLAVGVDVVESSVRLDGFITGILVLCLTQVFAYGIELQKDADGLL